MINPILDAFAQIAREKNIGREELVEMIEAGLVAAVRKKFGPNCEVDVKIDPLVGGISIKVGREVVEEVVDPSEQVSLAEAREKQEDIKPEDILWQEVPFAEFGRNAIQAAKQVVIQRIREAERDKIRAEYSGKIGELLSGTVQQVERGNYVIFLNRQTEAIMPMKEVNRKDRFKQGDPVRACLIDIRETTKGPQLILSRTHESFLKALFQLEVPEIYQGIIEIKGVVREAGSRSKIAVVSHDEHIDAVGACVGLKGSRVQAVVNEMGGERIDIIPSSDDPQEYVRSALNPAKIYKTTVDREEQTVTVVIDEDQLSLAIGKNGQNVRLASRLTGWKIEIVQKKDFLAKRDELLTGVFGGTSAVQEKPAEAVPVEKGLRKAEPAAAGKTPKPVAAGKAGEDEAEEEYEETEYPEGINETQRNILDELPVEDFPISLIEAITPAMRKKLSEGGYSTFYQLVLAGEDELCRVPGVGKKTSAKIKEIVDYLVEHYAEEEDEEEDEG
ncbi:MAG: transcription termination factor NusA [Candidatus Glassbacteria bacterium]|nr:transcription termination factor NusA [Candidatus Glassbacteria bacterium]